MTNPTVKRNTNQSGQSTEPKRSKLISLKTRRFAAWTAEITLIIASGLVPFGLGVYANSRTELNRVPLNPILVITQRAIAKPLALPVTYSTKYLAWPSNFLWISAILAPITLSLWQLYLLGKTGSTMPKHWFGVKVVNEQGTPAGLGAAMVREGLGRWAIPLSIAYMLWRYSFAFPNLSVLSFIAVMAVLVEGLGLPAQKRPRSFHDVLAGTYTIDALAPTKSRQLNNTSNNYSTSQQVQGNNQPDLSVSIPIERSVNPALRNPNLTLFAVGIISMIAVLSALVGTQIYIQSQISLRRTQQVNSEKFIALMQQLSPDSRASYENRRNTILAIGGINDVQAIKFLVDLLVKEDNPQNQAVIQQALTNEGLSAIPELKRMNQFLANELDTPGNLQDRESEQKQLGLGQKTINRILAVYSGKINEVDLSHVQLGPKATNDQYLFNVSLDNVDLSGINLKAANLNRGSFQGSRFHSPGNDGRWDTDDDVIADLTQAQLKESNFSGANLSRVVMNRSDLTRAILTRANLSNASLVAAKLSSAQLMGSDLSGAVLEDASLTGADISNAKLIGANLDEAHLVRASAVGAQLSYANLAKTDWQEADLSEAYLDRANLNNANLRAARLTGAILRSARIEDADLRNTDLSRADFQGAKVAGTDFQGATFFPAQQDPGDQFVQTPDTKSQAAIVRGVDFSEAKNLDARQLAFICTQGGIHPRCP